MDSESIEYETIELHLFMKVLVMALRILATWLRLIENLLAYICWCPQDSSNGVDYELILGLKLELCYEFEYGAMCLVLAYIFLKLVAKFHKSLCMVIISSFSIIQLYSSSLLGPSLYLRV